jgi:hypothetical protein
MAMAAAIHIIGGAAARAEYIASGSVFSRAKLGYN